MRGQLTPLLLWSMAAAPLMLAILKVRRSVFLGIAAMVGIGAVSAWIAFAAFGYRFSENLTHSLNGSIYAYKIGEAWERGDLVAYRSKGGYGYPAGATFIKVVIGVPGDVVTRKGRAFYVNGEFVGEAKSISKSGIELQAAEPGVIPEGEYFVATPNPNSFDSRYAHNGNVPRLQIIGRAREIF